MRNIVPLCGTLLLLASSISNAASPRPFEDNREIAQFIQEMGREYQFNTTELEDLFAKARLHQTIIDTISRPAESKPWYEYRSIFLTRARIRGGVDFWNDNALALQKAEEVYGVPAEMIVAIIGVETRYGNHKGQYPVLDSLSTLAFAYPPRSSFFRGELKQFLLLTREEKIDPARQLGSYAGAMGLPQFISSSFRSYAVDFDGDGHKDLWNTPADAIGSVANYFKRHGWVKDASITAPVTIKNTKKVTPLVEKGLRPAIKAESLAKFGITLSADTELKKNDEVALIALESDEDEKEFWLAWQNFYVITRYNHSALYAMAAYQLSQRIKELR